MRLTALNIRAVYALAKISVRFQLPDHAVELDYALASAAEFARRAARNAAGSGVAPACPLMFADEPALAQAWNIGLTRFPGGWDGTGENVPWWRDVPDVTTLSPSARPSTQAGAVSQD